MINKNRKVFTLQEASALLPDLEQRLKSLQDKKEAYSRAHDALFMHELVCAAERSNGLSNEQDDLEAGIHSLEETIEDLAKDVEEFFSLGGILRNLDKGHVEFLGRHEGETVYFSWQLGESAIQHYRPLSSRLHERLPLSNSKNK